jgi:hypothetical protein
MRAIFKIGIGILGIGILAFASEVYADTTYFRELADRNVTYISDGCYTACLLLGVVDRYKNFESQRQFLKEKGILPAKLSNAKANYLLRNGTAAYMFFQALDIEGGAITRIFGPSERYALRELVFKELVNEGPENKIVSGKELLSILLRASEYKANK